MLKDVNSFRQRTGRTLYEKSIFYKVSCVLLFIMVFINVTFPKAGIKLGGIPLTVGNVFLMLTIMMWFFTLSGRDALYFPQRRNMSF